MRMLRWECKSDKSMLNYSLDVRCVDPIPKTFLRKSSLYVVHENTLVNTTTINGKINFMTIIWMFLSLVLVVWEKKTKYLTVFSGRGLSAEPSSWLQPSPLCNILPSLIAHPVGSVPSTRWGAACSNHWTTQGLLFVVVVHVYGTLSQLQNKIFCLLFFSKKD